MKGIFYDLCAQGPFLSWFWIVSLILVKMTTVPPPCITQACIQEPIMQNIFIRIGNSKRRRRYDGKDSSFQRCGHINWGHLLLNCTGCILQSFSSLIKGSCLKFGTPTIANYTLLLWKLVFYCFTTSKLVPCLIQFNVIHYIYLNRIK